MTIRTWLGIALGLVSTLATAAPLTLTQSTSQTAVIENSVSCNNGIGHTDNSYWRAYDLAPLNLGGPVTIDAVQVGIEQSAGGAQPITVNVYTSAGAFPNGALTLRATQAVSVADQTITVLNVPLTTPTAPLPANSVLVLEVFTPDGRATARRFFIGSNSAAESAPSYISAANCGIPTPMTTTAIGRPTMHIILNASGTVDSVNTLAQNLACATAAVNALTPPTNVMGPAQKNTLLGLLGIATANQTGPYQSLALAAVRSVLARTDGCPLRGGPDTVTNQGGTGNDFVTTCPAQATIYTCLSGAEGQLAAPPVPR